MFSAKFLCGFVLGFIAGAAALIWADLSERWSEGESVVAVEQHGVQLVEHTLLRGKSGIEIVGTVLNSGRDIWNPFDVVVDFSDPSGKVLDVCVRQAFSPLDPGARRGFKIVCTGDSPEQFTSYAVRLGGGVRSTVPTVR